MRTVWVPVALGLLLLVGTACQRTPPSPTPTPSPPPSPTATPLPTPDPRMAVDPEEAGERAFAILQDLVAGGPRDLRSGGEEKAARFLAQRLEGMGYRVQRQTFAITLYSEAEPRVRLLSPQEREVTAAPMLGSPGAEVEAPLLFAGLGRPGEFPSQAEGKVVLVERGEITFAAKARAAAQAGALALLVFNNEPGFFRGSLGGPGDLPTLSLSWEDGQALRELLRQGEVLVRVVVRLEEFPSANVIAELPGQGEGLVLLGAHYDTVPDTVGAHDNGSGVAVLLALAEMLQGRIYPFTVRFVFFGGEEVGLMGSQRFMADFSPPQRSLLRAVLTYDALGAPMALHVHGERGLVARLQEVARGRGITLSTLDRPIPSDYLVFANAGVPAVLFTTPDFTYIHSPEDTLERASGRPMGEAIAITLAFLEALARE